MKVIKGLFWSLILSAILWVVILSCSYSMIAEVDLREEKIVHRAEYIKWWTERDLNTNMTQREWTR
jgi:hypothetical protein